MKRAMAWQLAELAASICRSTRGRRGGRGRGPSPGPPRGTAGRWPLGIRLEADATIPASTSSSHSSRDRPGARGQDRRLPARLPGRAWRLAAVPRRRLRYQRDGQGLFCAQADRRRPGRAAHGAGAHGDPGPGRRGALQRVHPHPAGPVRPGAVARRAGDAGRDHAAAALVPVPSGQGVLLVAHRDRAALDPDGAQAARAQSARRRDRRSCSSRRRSWSGTHRQPDRRGWGRSSWRSTGRCGGSSRCFPRRRARAIAARSRSSPSG